LVVFKKKVESNMKRSNLTTQFQGLPLVAGTFRSVWSTHLSTYRLFPYIVALAMAGSAFAQHTSNPNRTLPAKRELAHQRLPGERFTAQQRQALAAYGPDVSVEFGDQEVPSSITGHLSSRVRPDNAVAEAQAALEFHGAAFRRGPNDGFSFSALESDKLGMPHVRMTQTYRGIPVVGGELTVHLSRDQVIGISGHFVPDLNVPTDSAASRAQAAAGALSFARNEAYENAQVAATHEPVIFVDNESIGHLAIPVQITSDGPEESGQEDLYIDATSSQVLGRQFTPMSTYPPPCQGICPSSNLLHNPSFESGDDGSWRVTGGVISNLGSGCYNGVMCAYLDGYGSTHKDYIAQMVTIPSSVSSATLSFYLKIWTDEGYQYPYDTLVAQVRATALNTAGYYPGSVLATLATYSNVSAWSWPFSGGNYIRQSFDVTKFKGQTIFVYFEGNEDSTKQTSFVMDSVLLTIQ
jgi:hypothetical protein